MFSFSKRITCYVKWIFRLGEFQTLQERERKFKGGNVLYKDKGDLGPGRSTPGR